MATETASTDDDGGALSVECGDGLPVDGGAVCAKCRNLYIVNRGDRWWSWLCIKRPVPSRYNPVTGQTVADPPYERCRRVNVDGYCDDYSEGPNSLQPKDMPND